MTKNLARLVAGPVVTAGLAAGALGLAAAANADTGTVADLWSPHTGPAIASEPHYPSGEEYQVTGGIDPGKPLTAHDMR